jgi:lantibiotic modifying enzyme
VFKATGESKYREGLRRSAELLRIRAAKFGNGVEWTYQQGADTTYFFTDIVSGSSGIGLFMLYASRELKDAAYQQIAVMAGRRLIEAGQRTDGGMKWAMDAREPKFTTMFGRLMPNFAHGTAGICYFLASLYAETKQKEFLDAALQGTRYLLSIADTDSNAARIFHDEPDNQQLYYLGWCHGPAGTARLFYRLYQITGDNEWMGWVKKFARAELISGIPEHQTPGFWNNVSICCGTASVADFFLSLYRITHELSYLDFSKRLTANLLSRDTSDSKGIRWIQAEHRVRPGLLIAQTGYMQGAAGIGMWLLRLDAFEQGKRESITLPDSPFQVR